MKTTNNKRGKTSKWNKSKKTTSTVNSLGALTKENKTSFRKDTWVVFRTGSSRKPVLFEGKLTRDNVRGAYSKSTGTPFTETRSRRLVNYDRRGR